MEESFPERKKNLQVIEDLGILDSLNNLRTNCSIGIERDCAYIFKAPNRRFGNFYNLFSSYFFQPTNPTHTLPSPCMTFNQRLCFNKRYVDDDI